MATSPDGVELFDKGADQRWLIGQHTILEITPVLALGAHASACKVRAAKIGDTAIHDDTLEMHPRADHPLQSVNQDWEAVKVLPKGRPRLLGMDQPHLHAAHDEVRDHLQERDHAPTLARVLRIHVFDVRRGNPQLPLRLGNKVPDHPLINLTV